MILHDSLSAYLLAIRNTSFLAFLGKSGGYVTFQNSGKRGLKAFTLSFESFLSGLEDIEKNFDKFIGKSRYVEPTWRQLGDNYFSDLALQSTIGVQTKAVFTTLSKIISWANDTQYADDENINLDADALRSAIEKLKELIDSYTPQKKQKIKIQSNSSVTLPKSFILLAGISGTGKTRFVREQAHYFTDDLSSYCLVSVRPDWHEPSDLLGYISRLGNNGARYITTDFLRFIVAAWKHITDIKDYSIPYWLCLDEMNLAPVEQYFADYLSIIETRYWDDAGNYHCEALLTPGVFQQLDDKGLSDLQTSLGLVEHDALWEEFKEKGIRIPPNLIVAGTVNMDETTHGFSRKVIDRAFTLDFGEFFPNTYQDYFQATSRPKPLSFPTLSQVSIDIISQVPADADGKNSIAFLEAINTVLKCTPFELAYRALNELLLAVVCFAPEDALHLQAVWDDFLMTKVLPRIEGDSEKLQDDGENSLLHKLETVLSVQLASIWADELTRPDLLRESCDGQLLPPIQCRSKKKLTWMQARLTGNGFTSFWP